jgi:hypothetical protein
MKKGPIQVWWTHLPVLGLLGYLGIRLITAGPLPSRAPVHFGLSGQPDSWGSPWLTFGLTIGLSVFFGIIGLILDEVWARSEKRKSFNWLSLLDELVAGGLVGVSLGYLDLLTTGRTVFTFPWNDCLLTAGAAAALAIILELIRPFRPNAPTFAAEDTSALEKELAQRLADKQALVYWQSQNPRWANIVSIALPVVLWLLAAFMWFIHPWESLLFLVLGLAFGMLYGGLRTIVTRESVIVRLGLPGIRVLKIATAEIATAEILEFSPIKDFGGYGIRFNGKMFAYYLRGNRGIKISLHHGIQYLIGSDHPEQMLAVIKAVAPKNGNG